MDISDRFAQLWDRWDNVVKRRADVPSFLAQARDEDLVELLAADSMRDRKYERDVVATEVLNRLHRRTTSLPAAAAEVLRSAEVAYEAAAAGQKAIHTAEGILKADGQETLGAEVSASAYASLDTTRLAFEAAQQNSSDVKAAVSRSRVADQLAGDAAEIARRAGASAREAADLLERTGHREAGDAAQAAAERIEDATEATKAAVKQEREAEGVP